jgi:hypothetical protein
LPYTAVPARATAVGPRWFSCRRPDCASTVPLSVSGELDIARAPQPDAALGFAQADSALVILDPRELELMHSSGAHLIEAATGVPARPPAGSSSCATPSSWSGSLCSSALTANPSGRSSTSAAPAFVPHRG